MLRSHRQQALPQRLLAQQLLRRRLVRGSLFGDRLYSRGLLGNRLVRNGPVRNGLVGLSLLGCRLRGGSFSGRSRRSLSLCCHWLGGFDLGRDLEGTRGENAFFHKQLTCAVTRTRTAAQPQLHAFRVDGDHRRIGQRIVETDRTR